MLRAVLMKESMGSLMVYDVPAIGGWLGNLWLRVDRELI